MNTKFQRCLLLISILTVSIVAIAQTPRVVLWEPSDPNARQYKHEKRLIKELMDPASGVEIKASIRDENGSFQVYLEIRNGGKQDLDLRTEKVGLEITQPKPLKLNALSAGLLGRNLISTESARANAIESAGATAMKTETKTVVEHVHVPGATVDTGAGTDASRIVLVKAPGVEVVQRTVTETVPDTSERDRTRLEAARVRDAAQQEARRLSVMELKDRVMAPSTLNFGNLYFERTNQTEEALLRVPLGDLTVEIPFKTVRHGISKALRGAIDFE